MCAERMYTLMKTRIISGVIGVAVLLPVLYFSGTVVLPIALTLLSLIAAYEMAMTVGMRGNWRFLVLSFAYAVALPLLTCFMREGAARYIAVVALVTLLYILSSFTTAVLLSGKTPFSAVSEMVLGTIYATAGLAAIAYLRLLPDGAYVFGLVFVGAWVTDTMAYFTGVFLGKHKLCPTISPKKTVEGSIGGILFCILGFILYGWIVGRVHEVAPNYLMLAVGGLFASIISQIGDLTASLIKREHGVKDFGKLMPGHGGVLDRFDSIIAVALLLVLLCTLPEKISFFR